MCKYIIGAFRFWCGSANALENQIQPRCTHLQIFGSIKTIHCSLKDDAENKQVSNTYINMIISYGYLNCRYRLKHLSLEGFAFIYKLLTYHYLNDTDLFFFDVAITKDNIALKYQQTDRINLEICGLADLTCHKICGFWSRIGAPKHLYPGAATGSSSGGGRAPAPSWSTRELCSAASHRAVGSLCFGRAAVARSHVLVFVLFSSEKAGETEVLEGWKSII